MDLILERQQLIELARRVPATETRAAIIMLQALIVDPFWLSLQCAPLDDEELTPEAAVSILEAKPPLLEARVFRVKICCASSDSNPNPA